MNRDYLVPLGGSVLLAALIASTATAKPRRNVDTDVPPPIVDPTPPIVEAPPVLPSLPTLFDGHLPLDPGPVPAGLANLSAQSCAACHYDAHDSWATDPHRTGWDDPRLQAAFALAATPACTVCHQPLAAQHADRWVLDHDSPDHAATVANPSFDPTLATESVTCAACHVRDGYVVTAGPVRNAPHPTIQSAQLTESSLCATCHTITWPGADRPLYDTYGEWERSPQAKAGIQCQDCHMRAAVGEHAADHGMALPANRAVSVLVDVDRVDLVRGGPPLAVTVAIQNTGAGHAFPTGSPWGWVRARAALVGPVGKKGELGPLPKATTSWPLRRTIEAAPPWRTTADTRIAAGESSTFTCAPALPLEASPGPWALEVTLTRMIGDEPDGEPFVRQTVVLRVD